MMLFRKLAISAAFACGLLQAGGASALPVAGAPMISDSAKPALTDVRWHGGHGQGVRHGMRAGGGWHHRGGWNRGGGWRQPGVVGRPHYGRAYYGRAYYGRRHFGRGVLIAPAFAAPVYGVRHGAPCRLYRYGYVYKRAGCW